MSGASPKKDQDSFWKHVGKERNEQLESFVGKRKAMEQAVGQIVSPTDSQDVKLRKSMTGAADPEQDIRAAENRQEEKREKRKPAENVEDV